VTQYIFQIFEFESSGRGRYSSFGKGFVGLLVVDGL